MKKYLSLFVVLAMVLTINIQVIQAENGQNGTKIEKLKTEMQNKRDEARALVNSKIETMREEAKQKMEDLRVRIKEEKDGVKAKIKELRITSREKALERFDKAIERINNIKDKVNSKITELETKGVDVVDAKNFVAIAETKLTDAKSKIAEINTLLATSINELTLENKTTLKTLAKDTQTLIIEAHQALKDAVKSLKDATKVKIETENTN